jgi:hypothetical protein
MTTTSFQRHRSGWISICLPIALFIQPSCSRVKEEPPAALSPAVPPPVVPVAEPKKVEAPLQSSPVMAWGGECDLGYMRAELWAAQMPEHPSVQDLVFSRSDGTVHRYRGHMIRLPDDLAAARGPWRAFVRTPEDIEKDRGVYPEVMASVSPSGVLRVYEFSMRDGTGACNLSPSK